MAPFFIFHFDIIYIFAIIKQFNIITSMNKAENSIKFNLIVPADLL